MKTREEALRYGLSFPNVYQDAPFHDDNWILVRCRSNKKAFLWTYEYEGTMRINIKVDPEWRDFWRETYEAVLPGYHQNKEHWNTVILDGTIPDEDIRRMIAESYDLVSGKRKKEEKNSMRKRGVKKNRTCALAFLLAVLLWAEGTLGSVYAAPEAVSENTVVTAPAEEDPPTLEEGEAPASGEAGKPEEGEKPAPGEAEKPEEGDLSAPDESVSENTPDGEEAEGNVPENTPESDEEPLPEQIPGAGEALGEPPLMTEDGGAYGMMSYENNVMSTREGSITLQTPSTVDIIARYKAYPWSLTVSNGYSEKPSTKSPYKAGHLSSESLENALHLMNFIRYVAGIPADVTLSEEYNELAQAGALVNCLNGKLDHDPSKPAQSGFPDDLYEKGRTGCSKSNLSMGRSNIARSLLEGWMFDGDSANIDRMGHRRWVLNPSMTQTGFGAVDAFSAMYAVDRKGSNIKDYVAWPARNMPVELMNGSGTPWTLSLGSDYQTAERGQVTVTLKNVSTGKTWSFAEKKQDGYFKVNNEWYGMPNCIIFRPNNMSYDKTSQFQVTVTGLKDKEGEAATISYNVDFFSLSDTPKEVEKVTLDTENLHLLLNDAAEKNQGALHATLTPSNAADKTLKWKSLDESVATVTEDGMVTAVGVGETTVTVTATNGVQAACTVKVSSYTLSADGMEADKDTGTYHLNFEVSGLGAQGTGKKLTVKDGEIPTEDRVQWSSENQNVAAVDADGIVKPVGVGEATIWADVENGLKILACEVTVANAELPTMQIRESALTMKAGESRSLRAYLSPADTKWGSNGRKYIKWKSDQPGIVGFEDGQEAGSAETGGESTVTTTVSETISGNTVTVKALAAGKAKITAEVVDETGQTVGTVGEEKGRAVCEVTVQQTAELPAEDARPCLIALINTQSTLQDVALPEGWSWKYPDTSLTQFAGQRSKKFPALYEGTQPADEIQPAETFLPVYFLALENITVSVKHAENAGQAQDVSVLKSGWLAYCYVNYSFEETLEQFAESNAKLENNTWYKKLKTELLEQLDNSITLTSSKPQILRVETVKNEEGKTKLTAVAPGSTVLKAQLKLGKKTYSASQKLTVAENVDVSFAVSSLEHFQKSGEEKPYQYQGELSDFPQNAAKGINSKIILSMTGTTKLTVKSSNSKVVALKASTIKPTETVQFEVPLMVKAAGTAEITVTGNDAAKTTRTLTLVVTDACPGLSEETVTVNTWRTVGTDFDLYAAKDAAGSYYNITSVILTDDKGGQISGKFSLTSEDAADGSRRDCRITAKSDTKPGTYRMKIHAAAGGKEYDLPFTVKVVSAKPKCTVKQNSKLNLFYKDTKSLLTIDTEEKVKAVSLTGCNYLVADQQDGYYVKPNSGATLKSVKKGTLTIELEGWKQLKMSFSVNVEKKAPKISPVINTVTLYPKNGINTARIDIKNAETLPWNDLGEVRISTNNARGNYAAVLQKEEQAVLLQGKNLNQAESFRMTISFRAENWTEAVNLVCNGKVSMGQPAIALEKKTLQLNANDAYKGYDAASTAVKWKNGGMITTDQGTRVSVYCDSKDEKAKALVADSSVIFTVDKGSGYYQVQVRLNNRTVAKGNYKFIVQAAKDGKIWKTPLTLKVVDPAPDKAVKIAAKGSIDVLNRDGSFMTLTPSLKAVNGTFAIPDSREVKLTGRDAHLFRACWSADGKTIELRAKENETLVIKYNYTVTPVLRIRNVNGETEEIQTAPVKCKVKQGNVKVSAVPKTTLMYSNAYNSVTMDMQAVLKGAAAPEIENVTLVSNTDAFTYVYNNEGKGTLTMERTGRAVKGKNYSLRFQVTFAEQADNVKPLTVRCTVKVK